MRELTITESDMTVLVELLSTANYNFSRQQMLLDRWKDRPNVDAHAVKKATDLLESWKKRRDVLVKLVQLIRTNNDPG